MDSAQLIAFVLGHSKQPVCTILEMKQRGKKTIRGELRFGYDYRTDREKELRLRGRPVHVEAFVDRNRYKAEHCKRMRALNGVGNRRQLNSSHQQHFSDCMDKWERMAA